MTLESNFVFITPLIEDIFFKLYLIQRVILEVGNNALLAVIKLVIYKNTPAHYCLHFCP